MLLRCTSRCVLWTIVTWTRMTRLISYLLHVSPATAVHADFHLCTEFLFFRFRAEFLFGGLRRRAVHFSTSTTFQTRYVILFAIWLFNILINRNNTFKVRFEKSYLRSIWFYNNLKTTIAKKKIKFCAVTWKILKVSIKVYLCNTYSMSKVFVKTQSTWQIELSK